MDYKKYLKFAGIFFFLLILILLFIYLNKKTPNVIKNNPAINPLKISTSTKAVPTFEYNKPLLLSSEEKNKYGINTDEAVYLEMIPGNKDLPGPLPRLILPKDYKASFTPMFDKKAPAKKQPGKK